MPSEEEELKRHQLRELRRKQRIKNDVILLGIGSIIFGGFIVIYGVEWSQWIATVSGLFCFFIGIALLVSVYIKRDSYK